MGVLSKGAARGAAFALALAIIASCKWGNYDGSYDGGTGSCSGFAPPGNSTCPMGQGCAYDMCRASCGPPPDQSCPAGQRCLHVASNGCCGNATPDYSVCVDQLSPQCNPSGQCSGGPCPCSGPACCPAGTTCGPDRQCRTTCQTGNSATCSAGQECQLADQGGNPCCSPSCNPQNCGGACGSQCAGVCVESGAPDAGGDAAPLATVLYPDQTEPNLIAIVGGLLVWTNGGNGASRGVVKGALDGSGGWQKFNTWGGAAFGIAVDAANVYVTAPPSDVMSTPTGGTGYNTIASGQSMPKGIAANGSNVYWANQGDGTIMTLAPGPMPVATSQNSPTGIVAGNGFVCWTNFGSGPGQGSVGCLNRGNNQQTQVASGQSSPLGIALDSTKSDLYWVTQGSGQVFHSNGYSGPANPMTGGQNQPTWIDLDGLNIYWTNAGDGTVAKMERQGTVPKTIATGLNRPYGIVVDPTGPYVYVAVQGDPGSSNGSIVRIAKQ